MPGAKPTPNDRPLRIGIDYRPALLTSSGIGRSVRELARALARRADVELHLFGHSWSAARRSDPIPPGARLHRWPIPGRSLPWLAHLGLGAAGLSGRTRLFHWTDYVHPPLAGRRTAALLTLHDVAFAVDPDFHGPQSEELLQRSRRAAAIAARIIAPTRATADAAASLLGTPPQKIQVVPFGVDHVPRNAAAGEMPPFARPYVLVLGTIEPRKNHLRLLRAFEQLPPPRPLLVLAGRRGWQCDGIVAAIEERQRAGDLIWQEQLDDDTVYRYLRHAAALAYPSLHEGFGFPPLEAAALGTPVVAGNCAALRETLGEAARFCDPRDTSSITGALDAVLRHRGLRTRLRQAGQERARQFTWDRCAAGYAAAYRDLLAETAA